MSIEGGPGPEFLARKYTGLTTSPEVQSAAERHELFTGEEVPKDSSTQIQNYLVI